MLDYLTETLWMKRRSAVVSAD